MSILETFFVLFESNADKVEQASLKATAAGEKLAGTLAADDHNAISFGQSLKNWLAQGSASFDTIDEHAHEFGAHLLENITQIAGGFLAIFAAEKLVSGIFENAEMIDQLGKTAVALDVNVSDLDAWGRAATKAGGSSDGFQQSLRTLNASLQMMQASKGGDKGRIAPFLRELGIDAYDAQHKVKPIMELLPELAAKFQGLSKVEATGIGQKLGLDQGTVNLLEMGQKGVDELVKHEKSLGVVTDANVKAATAFNEEWLDTKQIFQELAITIGGDILPVITLLLGGIEDTVMFLEDHKDLVIGFFVGLAAVILGYYVPSILKVIETMRALTAAEIVSAVFNPFMWIVLGAVLAVAAIALITDDILNFYQGHNSVLGQMIKKWPELGAAIKELGIIIVDLKNIIVAAFNQMKVPVETVIEIWLQSFKAAFLDMGSIVWAFVRIFASIIALLFDIWNDPLHAAQNFVTRFNKIFADLFTSIGTNAAGLTAIWTKVGDDFDVIGNKILALWNAIGNAIMHVKNIGSDVANVANTVTNAASRGGHAVLGYLGLEPDQVAPSGGSPPRPGLPDPNTIKAVRSGQQAIQLANSPIITQGSFGPTVPLPGKPAAQSLVVNVAAGAVVVNTQASDPKAVAGHVNDALGGHITHVINHFSNGVQS